MNRELLTLFACPDCKVHLDLIDPEFAGDDVVAGRLVCPECQHSYKIKNGVADLRPKTR